MQNNKNDPNQKQPAFLQAAFIFIISAGLIATLWVLKLYRCPLEFIFGIPCPLCGITRAFLALFSGDISAAFYYHPLWPVILLSLILYVLYRFDVIKPSKRVFNAACIVLVILLLGCFILRHINGSPVVRIHFEESLLGRVISFFTPGPK